MTSPRPDRSRRMSRLAAALAGALALSACSSDGGGDWLQMFQAVRSSWESSGAPVKLDDAAAIPYATMGIRLDGGREQILILATDSGGERLWTSGTAVAVTTRGGRIVRTSGFGADLSGYGTADKTNWALPHSYTWTADFKEMGLYSVLVSCNDVPAGRDPITILGKDFDTIRVDETCTSDQVHWSFTNTFWVSLESGRVWRSIQQVHPKGPVFEMELLRPPLSPG
jgi:hypothetical protein